MRVLHACSEVFPLLKTGGLADVTGSLPPALMRLGCDVRMLLPGFPAILGGVRTLQPVAQLPARFGANGIALLRGELPNGVLAYVIDAPGLFDRTGNPYADASSNAYADNDRRFALLGWMAAELAAGLDHAWQPQLVHCHDWHAGLAPAYLRAAARAQQRSATPSVVTVHNLAYQGVFGAHVFAELGLPPDFYDMHGLEYYGQVSFLKAGLYYADRITTVSPTYAQEIQGPEQGCGLDGLLRARSADLLGILNGVDYSVWSPASDVHIASRYDRDDPSGKHACRRRLQQRHGLHEQDDAPIFGVVSRLTEQKGLHLLLDVLEQIVQRGGQLVLLGSGDNWLEEAFRAAALRHPQAVAVEIGYDETRSHDIVAGSDVILVPSRFEPCGLTQLYGLAYGTLPLVRRVGGLADTVVDANAQAMAEGRATGFVFEEFSAGAFAQAVARAFSLYQDQPAWQQVQRSAMQQHFSWDDAAAQMLPLYRALVPN